MKLSRAARWIGLGVALVAIAVVPTPAAAAANTLAITDVAFSATSIDTTAGPSYIDLHWTVTNGNTSAQNIMGSVELRQFEGSAQVGHRRTITFALNPGDAQVWAEYGSTAQQAHFTYQFLVPQYGTSSQAKWKVTNIVAQDGLGHTRRLTAQELESMGVRFTVTQLDDETPPTVAAVWLYYDQPSAVFDDGSGTTITYYVEVDDVGTGFRKGTLVINGPQDTQLSTPFEVKDVGGYVPECGEGEPVYDPVYALCSVKVVIPPGSPSGSWSVRQVRVTDNAGNAAVLREIAAPVVRVSRNDVISASDFAVSPAVVDNWRENKNSNLVFRPAGAVGGLAEVEVQTAGACWPMGTTPTMNDDGTASIPVQVLTITSECRITGIALKDAAGHEAFYGTSFRAPDLGLVITRLPDDTPPLVLSATLPKSTWTTTELETAWGIGLDVVVDNSSGAPVTGFSTTVFNALPASVGGAGGGIFEEPDGHLNLSMHTGVLPPGQYTVGFTLTDAGGRFTQLGYPNRPPGPNGPLIITVIEG